MAYRTLEDLRGELLARLGMGGMGASGGANQTAIDSFLRNGQAQLYRMTDWKHLTWYEDMDLGEQQNALDYPVEATRDKRVLKIETVFSGQWTKLKEGIQTEHWNTMDTPSNPTRYERYKQLLIYPKSDQVYNIRVWYIADLERFSKNGDVATLDDEMVFLHALANAKAHYRHPDAATYQGQLATLLAKIAGDSMGSNGVYNRTYNSSTEPRPRVEGRGLMAAINYTDFSGGLDRRLPIGVQEASRLWVLRNAYVTLGKKLKKRPGIRLVASGLTGSQGLEAISGRLKVFVDKGSAFVPPALVDKVEIDLPPNAAGSVLDRIHYADLFQGFTYVVAQYANGVIRHHYVDGTTSYITDANCPNQISVTKAASRIFAIGGEVVRYCKAGAPRDWTTASDAGFLPVGLQQDTKSACTAVGTFQDALVVFFPENAQIWNVAVDPSANAISKRNAGAGCKAPLSLASFSNDLVFLSPFGFRSMTVQAQTSRIDDSDVGVPVDTLVTPDLASIAALIGALDSFGVWIAQLGQYWAVFDMGTYSKVWAYTYSKSSKLACWSEYTFPVRIRGIATLDGRVYLRTLDQLYEVSDTQYTDDSALINVEIQMAFQDAKQPGVLKQIYGADYVVAGSPDISFKYDPRDLSKESISQRIMGDTRAGDIVPVEICAAAIAPVFRHALDEAFELDAASFYFNPLGLL